MLLSLVLELLPPCQRYYEFCARQRRHGVCTFSSLSLRLLHFVVLSNSDSSSRNHRVAKTSEAYLRNIESPQNKIQSEFFGFSDLRISEPSKPPSRGIPNKCFTRKPLLLFPGGSDFELRSPRSILITFFEDSNIIYACTCDARLFHGGHAHLWCGGWSLLLHT